MVKGGIMKVYVLVKMFNGIIDDVQIFKDRREAEAEFKEYIGCPIEEFYGENEIYDIAKENGTDIFEVDIDIEN